MGLVRANPPHEPPHTDGCNPLNLRPERGVLFFLVSGVRLVIQRIIKHAPDSLEYLEPNMTLQDWGALGELIGGIAIVVSLIYVGLQIRQSTHATRAATSQAFTAQYVDTVSPLFDPGFSEIYCRGLRGLHNLQEGEKITYIVWIATALRLFESFYFQEKDGFFDPRLFDGWSMTFSDLFAYEGPLQVLEIRKHLYNAQFIEFLQDRVARAAPQEMYSKADTEFIAKGERC
jgi:hypothetical protein